MTGYPLALGIEQKALLYSSRTVASVDTDTDRAECSISPSVLFKPADDALGKILALLALCDDMACIRAVSYTHLTLPTKCSV